MGNTASPETQNNTTEKDTMPKALPSTDPQDANTIEVRGFNPGTSDETIESFFENKRRSGGGEINGIHVDRENDVVRITYFDPKDADNVVEMSGLTLDGAVLTVVPVRASWDGRSIEVRGLDPSTSYDAVQLFFESKRRSGGDAVEHMRLDRDHDVAYVTFESSEVAANVLKGTLKLEGATLDVRPMSIISSHHQSTQLKNTSEKWQQLKTDDRDSDQFLNRQLGIPSRQDVKAGCDVGAERCDSLPIEETPVECTESTECDIGETPEQNRGVFPAECSDFEDARRILRQGHLPLEGAVAKMEAEEAVCGAESAPAKSRATVDTSSDYILEIRGFKPGTPSDMVEMFIENQSGESELRSFEYDEEKCVAVVAFNHAQGAAKLEDTPNLKLSGSLLSVARLAHSLAGLDPDRCRPRAVQVRGIRRGTPEELLQLLFENRLRTGGGDIESLDYNAEEGIAVIIFKDADTAHRVAQTKPYDAEVKVKLMTAPMTAPIIQGPFEENVVLVSGLSPECAGVDLTDFFSAPNARNEIQRVTFSSQPGLAMLQFGLPLTAAEYDRLREICLTKPLRRNMLSLSRVTLSRAIQVHNIGDVTEDMMTLYFENKRSGGGHVTSVLFCRDDDYAVFELQEHSCVRDILLKEIHKVDNQVLHVSIYHKCLGPIPPHYDTTKPSGWIPKNDTVTVNALCPRVWIFLLTSSTSRGLVDAEMAVVSAVVDWESYNDSANSVELRCSLRDNMEDAYKMANTWDRTTAKTLQDVLAKNFASAQLEILQEAWQPFLRRVVYIHELDPTRICVDICSDAYSVSFAGLLSEVESLSSRFEEDRAKVEEEMTREGSIVTETKSRLRWYELTMLRAIGFIPQQQKRFADLTIAFDVNSLTVRFTGMPADIMSAKHEMHDILSGMTERSVEMSASLISLLHGKTLMMHMVGQFKRENIRAICTCVGKTTLTVYALSDEHIATAIEVINISTTETSIDADPGKMLAPKKWTQLLKSLQSKHDGLLAIDRSRNGVVLTGEISRVAVALKEIQRFLGGNIVDNQFITMEYGVAAYLHTFKMEDIVEIVQEFRNGAVKITAKLDGPYGYVVSGNVHGLQGAVQKLKNLVDNVVSQQFTVDKPGLRQFVATDAGVHSLQRLNQKHKVFIEPLLEYTGEEEVSASADGAGTVGSGGIAAAGAGTVGSGGIAAAGAGTVGSGGIAAAGAGTVGSGGIAAAGAGTVGSGGIAAAGAGTVGSGGIAAAGAGTDGSGGIAAAGVGTVGSGGIAACSDNGGCVVARVSLPGSFTVEVVRGDLTTFRADAIVNFANGQLEHIEGLAKAIVDAGGPEIQWQCRRYVHHFSGDLAVDGVYVSTAGRLPCKHVIHAVLPVLEGAHSPEICTEELHLHEAVFRSLRAANQQGLSSIAFPASCCESFGFPIGRCTDIITSAVRCSLIYLTRLRKVSLVDPADDVLDAFRNSLVVEFGSQMVTTRFDGYDTSQGEASSSGSRTMKKGRKKTRSSPLSLPTSSQGVIKATHRKQTQLTTPEGIVLTLRVSELAKEKVDVVVNYTSRDLQLNQGAMSKSLLQAGGQGINTECQRKAPNGIKFGDTVVTSGGNLKCQIIVHGACCKWDGGSGRSKKILRQFLGKCFRVAHDKKLTSIAFPAKGANNLHFPHRLVANVLLEELRRFSRDHPQTLLRDVRFVAYPKNLDVIQAFEEVLFASKPESQDEESNRGGALATPEQGQQSITFNIFGKSNKAIKAAKGALLRLCDDESNTIARQPGSNEFPPTWSTLTGDEHVRLEVVPPTSVEYSTVKSSFVATRYKPINTIHQIQRVENATLYRQYMLCKKTMTLSTNDESTIWIGTSAKATKDVNKNGFKSRCYRSVTALGRRVYFAVELEQVMSGQNTAPITSGHKRMYQARTFINSTEGNVPPCFLFLQVNQTYPEYLITFS